MSQQADGRFSCFPHPHHHHAASSCCMMHLLGVQSFERGMEGWMESPVDNNSYALADLS